MIWQSTINLQVHQYCMPGIQYSCVYQFNGWQTNKHWCTATSKYTGNRFLTLSVHSWKTWTDASDGIPAYTATPAAFEMVKTHNLHSGYASLTVYQDSCLDVSKLCFPIFLWFANDSPPLRFKKLRVIICTVCLWNSILVCNCTNLQIFYVKNHRDVKFATTACLFFVSECLEFPKAIAVILWTM